MKPRTSKLTPKATGMTLRGRKRGTHTVPDAQRGGVEDAPDVVKALLLYGTDKMYSLPPLPAGKQHYTLGSASGHDISIPSPYVSAEHCWLVPTGKALQVVDRASKNGTAFEGKQRKTFELEPGKTFFVGARSHQLLALNDQMRAHYPALAAILGYEDEHVIPGDTPTPSDLIVAAVGDPHMLITSEPHCDQDRLANIVHKLSLLRERSLVLVDHALGGHAPRAHDAQLDVIQHQAATVLLNLGDHDAPLPPTFTSRLFSSKYQTRVIALAHTVDVANRAIGEQHVRRMKRVWLEPLSGRSAAIHRLLDRTFKEHGTLRVAAMTPHNRSVLRSHRWADNFASLREAASKLAVVARTDSLRQAAQELDIKPNTFTNWYTNIMGLEQPLLAQSAQ